MKIANLVKFGTAAHYSYIVESPFRQRGGLLLVSGPGNLKSTIVKINLSPFPNQLTYSDLTLKQLATIRSQIANGIYQSLGFLELEKIYARQQSVALNFEGVLKAMVEEGFSHFAFEDQRCWVPTARCFVYASVLDSLYRFHFPRWQDNGFLRRFIVFKYTLSMRSKDKIKEAIHSGELVEIPSSFLVPLSLMPMNVSESESRELEQILGSDDSLFTPLNLLRKCLTILKWHWKKEHRRGDPSPMEIIQDLKPGISPVGGELEI